MKLFVTELKADVNAVTWIDKRTPLHGAARNGHKEIIKILADNGANVYAKARNGRQPIHWAAIHNQADVVDVLVKKLNADIDAKDDHKESPLQLAITNGCLDVIERLKTLHVGTSRVSVVDIQTITKLKKLFFVVI